MGDPVGIGPEVVLKALSTPDLVSVLDPVVFGDLGVLRRAQQDCGIPGTLVSVETPVVSPADWEPGQVPVAPLTELPVKEGAFWGVPRSDGDRAQITFVEAAFRAVQGGRLDAMVTGPISKQSLARAGVPWPGHTEMLAELSGSPAPVMMLAGPSLKVVPVTTHIPLGSVATALTPQRIANAARVVYRSLQRWFDTSQPRVAVAGLNPHAGDGGILGEEEETIIKPAMALAEAQGVRLFGPFPPDSVYREAAGGAFDVVLGMYHDQALIPVKLLDFDSAVNVTLGLPIIRTSVDHGTAYNIAGRGLASPKSMVRALRMAAHMVTASRVSPPVG